MSRGKPIRTYEYVNYPYEIVRDYLIDPDQDIFQSATRSVASRASDLAAQLRFEVAGMEMGREISISIMEINRSESDENQVHHKTTLYLQWQASKSPGLFPLMKGKLAIYPLTRTETQLEFSGFYKPPLGLLGKAFDVVAGHRIAEASVHRFIDEIAQFLRRNLKDETINAGEC